MYKVTPKTGFRILHPYTFKTLAAEGEIVEPNYYWLGLQAEGGVSIEKIEPNIPAKEPVKNNEES